MTQTAVLKAEIKELKHEIMILETMNRILRSAAVALVKKWAI